MCDCVVCDAERTILAAGHPSISLRPVGERHVLPVAYERQAVLIRQSVFNTYPSHKFSLLICPQSEVLERGHTAALLCPTIQEGYQILVIHIRVSSKYCWPI